MDTSVVVNKEIYDEFLIKRAFKAKESLWIMTGVSTDFWVKIVSQKNYRISQVLKALAKSIEIKIITGKSAKKSSLIRKMEEYDPTTVFHCPRTHGKTIIVDGKEAYIGSGNLTGTGVGKVSSTKRNWEVGVIITQYLEVWKLIDLFQRLWEKEYCSKCAYKGDCKYKNTF